eukprot:2939990-Prymnesium_polylepis.1
MRVSQKRKSGTAGGTAGVSRASVTLSSIYDTRFRCQRSGKYLGSFGARCAATRSTQDATRDARHTRRSSEQHHASP